MTRMMWVDKDTFIMAALKAGMSTKIVGAYLESGYKVLVLYVTQPARIDVYVSFDKVPSDGDVYYMSEIAAERR